MKVRVIFKDGMFYSQYYDEAGRTPHWEATFRNNNAVNQNEHFTIEAAIEECKWFAKNNNQGSVVWKDEINIPK